MGIQELLKSPNQSSPAQLEAYQQYVKDKFTYEEKVREIALKNSIWKFILKIFYLKVNLKIHKYLTKILFYFILYLFIYFYFIFLYYEFLKFKFSYFLFYIILFNLILDYEKYINQLIK